MTSLSKSFRCGKPLLVKHPVPPKVAESWGFERELQSHGFWLMVVGCGCLGVLQTRCSCLDSRDRTRVLSFEICRVTSVSSYWEDLEHMMVALVLRYISVPPPPHKLSNSAELRVLILWDGIVSDKSHRLMSSLF